MIAGTRGSKLAVTQTKWVADRLADQLGEQLVRDVELKTIMTRGDKIHDVNLARLEGKGFFTKEIDEALLAGEIDFAVHSMKDIPTDLPDGIIIAAIPVRESPLDALVSQHAGLDALPPGSVVGTSSQRRACQIRRLRPDIEVKDLRGNLDTRVRKQKEGQYDAVIVAEAGLKRLGYSDYYPLDPRRFIPAAAQGGLAVTARIDDTDTLDMLAKLEDPETRACCEAERSFLICLEGGCQIPAGIYIDLNHETGEFTMTSFISSLDGKRHLEEVVGGKLDESLSVLKPEAEKLATSLLDKGGLEIIREIRGA